MDFTKSSFNLQRSSFQTTRHGQAWEQGFSTYLFRWILYKRSNECYFWKISIPLMVCNSYIARFLVDSHFLFLNLLQGELIEKDFNIKKQTNGKSYTVVLRQYVVKVTANFMEIHLFWAGKGTCCIPETGSYGPLISALSVSPYGTVHYLT